MFAMARLRVGWLLAVLLLGGCAGVPGVPLTDMRSIKRVAMISMIGDKFTVQRIGLNPFDSNPKPMPIAAWGLDRFVVKMVSGALARRFEVSPLAYQPVPDWNDVAVKIAEGVRAQSGATDIDAYIVVSRGMQDTYSVESRRERYFGLGIIDHALRFGQPKVGLYVLYDITVVDGHDLSVVASTQKGVALGGRSRPILFGASSTNRGCRRRSMRRRTCGSKAPSPSCSIAACRPRSRA
jgi:hypothetical protein